jgi:hypothetical protein
MYSNSELKNEILEVIQKTITERRPASSAWIAMEICNNHPLPDEWSGDDYEFWMMCGTSGVQSKVRAVVNQLKNEQDKGEQLDLPGILKAGFKHLQEAYFIANQSDEQSIPILLPLDQMTDEQIDVKAEEYERMAIGCQEHADELRRYRRDRKAA